MLDSTRYGRYTARGIASALLVSSLCGASPAAAGVTESVTVQNVYGLAVGSDSVLNSQAGGSKGKFYAASNVPYEKSEVGVNFEGTASPGNLFFLHDNYCVGYCSTYSQTTITFSLTNTGTSAVDLRFDSQITPGHIARILGDSALNGSFNFSVSQGFSSEFSTLYSANGGVNSDGIYLNSGNLLFNGLNSQSNQGVWDVLDWGATNLSVPLFTLGAGQSTQVRYQANYQVSSNASCLDVTACAGLQIVFGDPRNDGGVSSRPAFGFAAQTPDPAYPVIGRNYDASNIFAQFVPIDTPLPDQPDAPPPVNYGGPLFNPRGAVPEPSNWMLMIGGIGVIGGVARRRRRAYLIA